MSEENILNPEETSAEEEIVIETPEEETIVAEVPQKPGRVISFDDFVFDQETE